MVLYPFLTVYEVLIAMKIGVSVVLEDEEQNGICEDQRYMENWHCERLTEPCPAGSKLRVSYGQKTFFVA